MISIVNYGIGNLASIKNMLKKAGYESELASDINSIDKSTKIILPGIGAFDHCMLQFNLSGLREILTKKILVDKIPLLGICVGLQMLMENSEEGLEPGLGWIDGKTIKFKKEDLPTLKIPHMGWSEVTLSKHSMLTNNLGFEPRFYFVHSYYVKPVQQEDVLMVAEYGSPFVAGVNKGNIYGVQFHPEKSHRFGMKILENFASL